MFKVVIIILTCMSFIGCADQSVEKYKKRSEAEQEGVNKVENQNQATKAEAMEKDLAKKQLFYSALEGEYQGSMQIEGETYRIRFTFARSIPPYTGNRIRQLSEIENDINNLYFNMHVVQWHPADQSTSVSCPVTGLRPNTDEGTFTISSPDCKNLYTIMISEGGKNSFTDRIAKAKRIATKVKNLEIKTVPYLIGTVQPSSNAGKYSFSVKKLN